MLSDIFGCHKWGVGGAPGNCRGQNAANMLRRTGPPHPTELLSPGAHSACETQMAAAKG